jgi:hypothetical protein
MGKSKAVSSHRSPRNKDPESHAKARRVGDRVPLLPKTFCGHEGVLECSGLTELWMGSNAPMGKSKAVSSHRSPRNKDPESHAETRRVGGRVPQLPKTFCSHEGVLECSGLTELWMGSNAPMGKSKAVSSHRSPRNQDPAGIFLIQISGFRIPPRHQALDSRIPSLPKRPLSVIFQLRDLGGG